MIPEEKPRGSRQLAALIVVLGLVTAGAVLFLASPNSVRLEDPPKPNGYDLFLKAVAAHQDAAPESDQASLEALATHVRRNTNALALAREGLRQKCLAPVGGHATNSAAMLSQLASLKALALTFRAEGRMLERQSNYVGAARSYLDTIRFGHEVGRGAQIDMLVGLAAEAIGVSSMAKIVETIPPAECASLAGQLLEGDAGRDSFETIARREKALIPLFAPSLTQRFGMWWMRRPMEAARQKAAAKLKYVSADVRLLACALAARAASEEAKKPVLDASELVPKWLRAIPQDPFSGQPLKSKAGPKGIEFYSVGSDGQDDNGKHAGKKAAGGDWFLGDKRPAE